MIREELSDLIAGEMQDPRLGLATVTEVRMAPEMRVALVFVAVGGGAAAERQALDALMGARKYLRSELGMRLRIRTVPDLKFQIDRSEVLEGRIDELLRRSAKRDRATQRRETATEERQGPDER